MNEHAESTTAQRRSRRILLKNSSKVAEVTERLKVNLAPRANNALAIKGFITPAQRVKTTLAVTRAVTPAQRVNITLATTKADANKRTLAGQRSESQDEGVDHDTLTMSTTMNFMAKYCVIGKPPR